MKDHEIRRALQEKYGFEERFRGIRVECAFGKVVLRGTVGSAKDKKDALAIADKIRGIRKLDDRIKVREK